MYFNRRAFLGQVRLLGQAESPTPPASAAPPAAAKVTAEQFQKMSSTERSKVLDGLSSQEACVLYQQLYAITKDPKDEAFMKSWCEVAEGK